MKNILIALMCLLLPGVTLAQKGKSEVAVPKMPVDESTGLITYAATEQVTGSRAELFNRALGWANGFYKNPNEVIREKDAAAGRLVIKGRYRISNEPDKKGVATQAGNVMYTLTMEFKDGRYRYTISNFNWQQTSAFPIERWMETDSPSYTKNYPYYLVQTDDTMRELEKNLKKAMATAEKAKSSDW